VIFFSQGITFIYLRYLVTNSLPRITTPNQNDISLVIIRMVQIIPLVAGEKGVKGIYKIMAYKMKENIIRIIPKILSHFLSFTLDLKPLLPVDICTSP
jgi:hypothetical protein